MRLLDRYIGRAVLLHSLVVLGVLLSLYFFSFFVSELDNVGQNSYTLLDALLYTIMLLPRQAYEIFPMVALIGSMLGLGTLANNSELTVIRAAGVSVRRVLGSVVKVGMIMVISVVLLGEGVAPWLEKQAREWRAEQRGLNVAILSKGGLWARNGNTFFQITSILSTGEANGIKLFRLDDGFRVKEIVVAERAVYERASNEWQLQNVETSTFGEGDIISKHLDTMLWKSSLTPDMVELVSIPPENLSIWDLVGYIRYLRENELDSGNYELSLWIRIMTPIATAGMVLLAVPFVFGSMRSVSLGRRITMGALIGIGFYLFNAIFSRLGLVYSFSPFLSAALPTIIIYIVWVVMMRRIR